MKKRLLILYLAIFSLLPFSLRGAEKMVFSHFTAADGLSQDAVNTIIQDIQGNMWFGTENGLNCYNGQYFEVFRNDPKNLSSIPHNNVRMLHLAPDGSLWAACGTALSMLDASTGGFVSYHMPEEAGDIYDFIFLDDSHILLSCRWQMVGVDLNKGIQDDSILPFGMKQTYVSNFVRYGDDCIFMTSRNSPRCELFKWIISTGAVTTMDYGLVGMPAGPIVCTNESLWIGTNGAGLLNVDISTGREKRITMSEGLCSNIVRSLLTDGDGRIWVGTSGGLSIIKDGQVECSCLPDKDDDTSISYTSIKSLFMDTQGGIWLGSHYFGVDYYHPLRGRFKPVNEFLQDDRLSQSLISAVKRASDGSLWIAATNEGIFHYSPNGRFLRSYRLPQISNTVITNDFKDLLIDEVRNRIYVCAHSGNITAINPDTGSVKAFYTKGFLDVYSVLEKNDVELYVGSLFGLFLLNRDTEKLTHLDSRFRIKVMKYDADGNLWLGGDTGIMVLNHDLKEVTIPAIEGMEFVHCLHLSSSGIMWIGSNNGLCGYNRETGKLISVQEKEGLSNNVVLSIEEDATGRLWLGTSNGLSSVDRSGGLVRGFFLSDGLPCQNFHDRASLSLPDGTMIMGARKGLIAFSPSSISDNPFTPLPQIHIRDAAGNNIIPSESKIVLGSSSRSFSVSFSVPNYLDGDHSVFAFKSDLSDDEWHERRGGATLNFTNIRPGKYRFSLKAANSSMRWCPQTAQLSIVIKPRWFETKAFLLLVMLLVVAVIAVVAYVTYERANLKRKLEADQKEMRYEEDLHQMKIGFFINMLHELKTPLTLLVAPLQEMISYTDSKWMRKQLLYLRENAGKLSRIVSQMMDYRRAELGIFKLQVYKQNVDNLLEGIVAPYNVYASAKGLDYSLNSSLSGADCLVDGQYLEMIMNNLLSNAFKYTKKGSVKVNASIKGGNLIIEVADTGSGIPHENQDHIFDRFYRGDSGHFGSGVGLSIVKLLVDSHHGSISMFSEEGKGSSFMVCLPQNTSAYSNDEMAEGTPPALSASFDDSLESHFEEEDVEIRVPEFNRGSVLIVEDDPSIRRYLNEGLSGYFDVLVASNGEEALTILSHNTVDVVLTDLVMPVMDGQKLCAHIKRNVNTSHIPVIIVSAKNSLEDQLATFQSGADDFISKPFSMTSLVAKVHNTIETRRNLVDRHSHIGTSPIVSMNAMDREFIEKATSVVKENLANSDFSTVDLAAAMCVSRSSLHIKLKAICGESALDFIRKIRFGEACRLLQEGEKQITEISELTGFSSLSYFSTAFKNYVGCLPSEYMSKQ